MRRNGAREAAGSPIELDQERTVSIRSHQRSVPYPLVDVDREIVRAPAAGEKSKDEGVVAHFLCGQRATKRSILLASFSTIRGEELTENGGHLPDSFPGQ
jgi:hypothetical protein